MARTPESGPQEQDAGGRKGCFDHSRKERPGQILQQWSAYSCLHDDISNSFLGLDFVNSSKDPNFFQCEQPIWPSLFICLTLVSSNLWSHALPNSHIPKWDAIIITTSTFNFSLVPTIAAINGHCYAGGLMLSLVCDYRVMTDGSSRNAWLCMNEVRRLLSS